MVRRAARALAELHTSGLDTADLSRRTGADEAGKAAKRARLLERYVPELAAEVRRVAGELCAALADLPAGRPAPRPRELQAQPAAGPRRRGVPRGLRPVLPGRPRPRRRILPRLPAACRALVPPRGPARVVRGRRRAPSSRPICSASPSAGESGGRPCGHRRPRAGVRGRAAPQDRRAPGQPAAQPAEPARWRRCSRRSRARSPRRGPGPDRFSPPGSARQVQPARFSTVSVPSSRLLT